MNKRKFDEWPPVFRDLRKIVESQGDRVLLGEDTHSGSDPDFTRKLCVGLVDPEEYELVDTKLEFGHEVNSQGPWPHPREFGLELDFWIDAPDSLKSGVRPVVLGWTQNVHETLLPNPNLPATYGLSPQLQSDNQTITWNDLSKPLYDVIRCAPYAEYCTSRSHRCFVDCLRDYFIDYCNMQRMQAVCFFYENRVIPESAVEASHQEYEADLDEARVSIRKIPGYKLVSYQIWGRHTIYIPCDEYPISKPKTRVADLKWPGVKTESHGTRITCPMMAEVFVSDSVLGKFENNDDYSITPRGSVSYGSQWDVSFCSRVGRDTIKLELRKLYEGTNDEIIRHYHGHAIEPVHRTEWDYPNVATRTKSMIIELDLLDALILDLGDQLGIANQLRASPSKVDSNGDTDSWWRRTGVSEVMNHIPRTMTESDFRDRCLCLANLVIESILERNVRRIAESLGEDRALIKDWRSLKLLGRIAELAHTAMNDGLRLPEDWKAVDERITETNRPKSESAVHHLIELNRIRQSKAHLSSTDLSALLKPFGHQSAKLDQELGMFLDRVYDLVVSDLSSVTRTLETFVTYLKEVD